jgi:hypothetical protein
MHAILHFSYIKLMSIEGPTSFIKKVNALVLSVSKWSTDGAKPSKYKTYMPKPKEKVVAPADDKSGNAAGDQKPADKGGKESTLQMVNRLHKLQEQKVILRGKPKEAMRKKIS